MNLDDLRVTALGMFAVGLPAANSFLQNAETGLKCLLLLGQAGIAVFTFLYVYKRWKNTGGNYKRKIKRIAKKL